MGEREGRGVDRSQWTRFQLTFTHTLMHSYEDKVEHYRVRKNAKGKVTVDDEQYFENLVRLVEVGTSVKQADALYLLHLLSLRQSLSSSLPPFLLSFPLTALPKGCRWALLSAQVCSREDGGKHRIHGLNARV